VFLSDSLKTRLVRRVMVTLYRRAMKRCPAVFFQNRDDEAFFRRHGIVKDQKVVLLHGSGVNTERFALQPPPETPAFLCVSRLIRDKGVYEYLSACRALKKTRPEVRCMLVGPYDSHPSALKPEELQPFIDDGSVEYFGEQFDVLPYLARCSVFVLPSYREGTPKSNLEAMSCGRAVITTDAPGCRETVEDGVNGFLVPVRDADAVREKMEWCLDHPEQTAAMGRRGRAVVERDFDVNKVNAVICETMGLGGSG
jgi:glycosyltransferase involved in cell wall biosynthesis